MARLPTLQWYIFREMGKTFAMSAIGLTGVLSTCGGVLTLLPLESISAGQTLMLLVLVIPVCAAFTLPIAALFSATITYGRMAADNEFTALRSSGVNTFALFKPCLTLSLLSGAITFVFFNFLIPALTGKIRHIAQASVMAIMSQSLDSGRGIEFRNFRIYADEYHTYSGPDVAESEGFDALWLKGVVFMEFESAEGASADPVGGGVAAHEELVRLGTSQSALIKFDRQTERVEADLADIVAFDLERVYMPNAPHPRVGPFEIMRGFRAKPRHLSLTDLLEYRHRPEEVFEKVAGRLSRVQQVILATLLFDHFRAQLAAGQRCSLQAEDSVVDISIDEPEVQVGRDRRTAWLELSAVKVEQRWSDSTDVYEADHATLALDYDSAEQFGLLLELGGQIAMFDNAAPQQRIELRSRHIGPLEVPQEVVGRFRGPEFAAQRLWDRKVHYDLGPDVAEARKELRKQRSRYLHQIYAEISVRAVYSVSVILLAALGAALGIILRGGQVLVAFGISFLPTLFVILTAILGKSLAKGQGTLEIGLGLMWLGLAVVLVIDCVVFKKYLPR